MESKDIIVIFNRIKDVMESESENSKLTLNKDEVRELYKYLKALKKQRNKDINLIRMIQTEIYRYNEE